MKLAGDMGGWIAAIVTFVVLIGTWLRGSDAKRERKRAEKAAATAELAEREVALQKALREAEAAQATHSAAKARIEGMDDDALLADARARIRLEESGPHSGLFNPPPKDGKPPGASRCTESSRT